MNENVGKLILRVVLGVLILLHGIAKLKSGIAGIFGLVVGAGFPAFVAYGVYIGQLAAPVMVIAGWYSRIGAAVIAITMVFAIGLVHGGELFALNKMGGWAIELQAMYLFTAVAVALLGPGRFSINSK
jgi:putative oxidoreductase